MNNRLKEAAIVTGGGSGIGRATAIELARRGHPVSIFDIDVDAASKVAAEVHAALGSAMGFRVDVANAGDIASAVDEASSHFGIARILVNCAGILNLRPALETSVELFDRTIAVNLRSVFSMSTEVARRMVAAGLSGSITSVSSVHALVSEPNASAYTASKGGIEALSRTLASEWAANGIRVNCVRPGAIWTNLSTPLYTPEVLRALAQRVPLQTPGTPEQVAAGICFLASDDASYITGTSLDIDGGFAMNGALPGAEYK